MNSMSWNFFVTLVVLLLESKAFFEETNILVEPNTAMIKFDLNFEIISILEIVLNFKQVWNLRILDMSLMSNAKEKEKKNYYYNNKQPCEIMQLTIRLLWCTKWWSLCFAVPPPTLARTFSLYGPLDSECMLLFT